MAVTYDLEQPSGISAIAAGEESHASKQAVQLATALGEAVIDGRADVISDVALQQLMAALCKLYAYKSEAQGDLPLLNERSGVCVTDAMVTTSALLKAVDIQVFELGMWQSWGAR